MSGSFGKLYYAGVPVYRSGAVVGRGATWRTRAAGTGSSGRCRAPSAWSGGTSGSSSLAGAASAAIALFLARLLARGMTQPLRDMALAAERLAHGDYSERVQVTSRDELGQDWRRRSTGWRPSWRASNGCGATWWPTCRTS